MFVAKCVHNLCSDLFTAVEYDNPGHQRMFRLKFFPEDFGQLAKLFMFRVLILRLSRGAPSHKSPGDVSIYGE